MTDYFRMDGSRYEGPEAWLQWAKDFKNRDARRIGWDDLGNGKIISTVWIGLNYNFSGGPPLIF